MAGKINSFLSFLKLVDEDDYDDDFYDDYDDDDLDDERERRKEEKRLEKERRREEKRMATAAAKEDYFDSYDEPAVPTRRSSSVRSSSPQPKVVPLRGGSDSDVEVCIIKPENFGESQQVCETLLEGQPVVVNLEGIDILEAQRIMDFISGCIFSISGNMRQVSRYIFIFAPKSIDISGDYVKNVKDSDGFSIPTLNKEF